MLFVWKLFGVTPICHARHVHATVRPMSRGALFGQKLSQNSIRWWTHHDSGNIHMFKGRGALVCYTPHLVWATPRTLSPLKSKSKIIRIFRHAGYIFDLPDSQGGSGMALTLRLKYSLIVCSFLSWKAHLFSCGCRKILWHSLFHTWRAMRWVQDFLNEFHVALKFLLPFKRPKMLFFTQAALFFANFGPSTQNQSSCNLAWVCWGETCNTWLTRTQHWSISVCVHDTQSTCIWRCIPSNGDQYLF